MKILVVTITGNSHHLLNRIEQTDKIEDYEYFKSGLCSSLADVYDEEWEGFVEDNREMLDIMTHLHVYYKPILKDYMDSLIERMGPDTPLGFDVSINPLPSEGVHLLTVKPYKLFDESFDTLSYTDLNLI